MNSVIIEISFVLILLVANGVFAMTEIAIVSSRKGRLQGMADKGNSGAARALRLSESPNRFLSTVPIGITLVGIVAYLSLVVGELVPKRSRDEIPGSHRQHSGRLSGL